LAKLVLEHRNSPESLGQGELRRRGLWRGPRGRLEKFSDDGSRELRCSLFEEEPGGFFARGRLPQDESRIDEICGMLWSSVASEVSAQLRQLLSTHVADGHLLTSFSGVKKPEADRHAEGPPTRYDVPLVVS
jgi:hypothetical protein